MRFRLPVCVLLLLPLLLFGGLGPQNVAVLVNVNDRESVNLGRLYADQRGIPDAQIIRLAVPVQNNLSTNELETLIRAPMEAQLQAFGLSTQVQTIAVCWTLPFRVETASTNRNSLVSALASGYVDAPTASQTVACNLNPAGINDFFGREWGVGFPEGHSGFQNRLVHQIGGETYASVSNLVLRSQLADGVQPVDPVYLLHTTDVQRNLRWVQFEDAHFSERFLENQQDWFILDGDTLGGATNVGGYVTGDNVVQDMNAHTYGPGAIADHLTSFGGYLSGSPGGQDNVRDWVDAGASGSFGTVVEPCNYIQKFPDTRVQYWNTRGFSLAESYGMAVEYPYEGVTIGDPLMQTHAVAPHVQLSGVSSNSILSGSTSITVEVTATSTEHPVDRLDLFVDGEWRETVASYPPLQEERITVTVGTRSRFYSIGAGDDLEDVVNGLTGRMNSSVQFAVDAGAFGDRIEFNHDSLPAGTSGAGMGVSVANTGSRTRGITTTPVMLDPLYPARQQIALISPITAGDVYSLTITTLAGSNVTVSTTAVGGQSQATVLQNLMNEVNNEPALQDANGCSALYRRNLGSAQEMYLVANEPGFNSANLSVLYQRNSVTQLNTSFLSNQSAMRPRGTFFIVNGETNITQQVAIETTGLADGPHELSVVAYEGTAVRTQGRAVLPVIVDNHDLEVSLVTPADGFTLARGETLEVRAIASDTATNVSIWVEGKFHASTGGTSIVSQVDTSGYADGALRIQARSRDGAGNETWSGMQTVILLLDSDEDLLPDQWELDQYGNIALFDGDDDPDLDLRTMYYEYLTGTQGTNGVDFFTLDLIHSNQTPTLRFTTVTNRWYQAEVLTAAPGSTNAWNLLTPVLQGTGGWIEQALSTNGPQETLRVQVYR